MSIFFTAKRKLQNSDDFDRVLMDGDHIVANLGHFSTVEEAYQSYLAKSQSEFDWRCSGHLRVDLCDDWDQALSEMRWARHKRDRDRALEMVTLLEPHRKAIFVEPEWQKEQRQRREREAAEAVKLVYKVPADMTPRIEVRNRNPKQRAPGLLALLHELGQLTGLKGVKQDVETMVNVLKMRQARKASGLKTTDLSLHMVFHGNPGTGKTTVARLLAAIYRELGVLSKGHMIETDRSGLVGEYLGQTAPKVQALVTSAMGGILFIDEAYALTPEEGDEYGSEAIAKLVKLMEDHRDKFVVIVAGYPKEMHAFLEANPGLRSRFNNYLTFEDYNGDELTAIFQCFCRQNEYDLTPGAESAAHAVFRLACEAKDSSFGNGRLARNCFEHAVKNHANRIASQAITNIEALTQLQEEDVPAVEALLPKLVPRS